jgi:hypothetical protein
VRKRWEILKQTFERITLRSELHAPFQAAAKRDAELARFSDIDALRQFLVAREGDLAERDAVLGALAMLVRVDVAREIATALLWLALWPGLDAIYRRRLRCLRRTPDELASAIAVAFTVLVLDLDLTRVHRVAGTLVRSTEREVLDQLRRTWRDEARFVAGNDDGDLDGFMSPTCLALEAEVRALRAWLVPEVGADADLLLAVTVFGDTQSEAADELGISAAAARKRYQRALTRLRVSAAGGVPA